MQGKRLTRLGSAALAVATVMMFGAASAPADGDSLTLQATPNAPSGFTPVTITASVGATTTNGSAITVFINDGDEACPSDPATDTGRRVISVAASGGSESTSSAALSLEHGEYTICGWLADPVNGTATANLPLSVSNPSKLTIAVSPTLVTDGFPSAISITGVADVQGPAVYVTRKPLGTGGCAASPAADSGTQLPHFDPAAANYGSFTASATVSLGAGAGGMLDAEPPGTYLLCAWLVDASQNNPAPVLAAASTTVTLTAPTGTLAYSLPELVSAGSPFSVAMSYSASSPDVALYLDLKPLPVKGMPCAATHARDRGAVRLITARTAGTRSITAAKLTKAGVYVACAWLEWPHGTIDGPFAGRFVVARRHQRSTLYYGVTSQHLPRSKLASNYPIVFREIDGQIVNLAYFARFACTRPGRKTTHPIYSTSFPAFGLSSPTRFGYAFVQGTDHAVVHGRLGRRRATGTVSESYTSGGYLCRSGPVSFSARRG